MNYLITHKGFGLVLSIDKYYKTDRFEMNKHLAQYNVVNKTFKFNERLKMKTTIFYQNFQKIR